MLIPTEVDSYATLANPGTDYWCGTAAHYYINPPGTSTADACVWGTNAKPVGNWSPYVAGSNVDASGNTYIKLGWNPIYLEQATPFRTQMPNWGVKIDCPNGGCNGLPCSIDPTTNQVNGMSGAGISYGAGGGSFCVVTVAKGSTANFVVYSGSGSSSSLSSSAWSGWNGASPIGSNQGTSTANTKTAGAFPSGNSISISGGVGLGGQFYAVTSGSASSSTSTATTTSTSTTSTTSKTSSATTTAYATWTGYNVTGTGAPTGPSGSPYYSLFNSSLTATKTGASNGHSGTAASGSKTSSTVSIAKMTGGASQLGMGAVGVAVGLWSLFI